MIKLTHIVQYAKNGDYFIIIRKQCCPIQMLHKVTVFNDLAWLS